MSLEDLLYRSAVPIRSGGNAGTGVFVAPNTILTCAHVVPRDDVTIIWAGREVGVTVRDRLPDVPDRRVDPYPGPDLAFLETPDLPGHPYVELDRNVPRSGYDGDGLWAVGFTQAFQEGAWTREELRITTTGAADGLLLRVTGARVLRGMSGAPVLNVRTGRVCGLMKRTADDRVPNGGWFVPLAPLVADVPSLYAAAGPSEGWREERRKAIGPALEQLLVVEQPERPTSEDAGPSWPLRAEYKVVPFHGRDGFLEEHVAWCERAGPLTLRLLTGQGGTGKTRLALELVSRMIERGWIAGLLDSKVACGGAADRAAELAEQLGRVGEDALVVIDYAEGRPELADLLDRLAEIPLAAEQRLRVLLLARHHGEWWTTILPSRLGQRRMRQFVERRETVHELPGLSDSISDQHKEFALACRAFAQVHQLPGTPSTTLVPADDRPPVLQVHAAALLAVLRAEEEPVEADHVDIRDVLDGILARENRFWTRSVAARGLTGMGQTTHKQAVALTALVGADDARSAAALLRKVFELSKAHSIEVAAWLSELYPVRSTDETRYWAPLRPDILGEYLIVQVFSGHPDLADTALDGLPDDKLANALIVLTRACAHSSKKARPLLARLLRADRLALAVRTAPKAGEPLGSVIKDVVAGSDLDDEVMQDIVDALPNGSVELNPLMAYVLRLITQETASLQLEDWQLAGLHEGSGNQLMLMGELTEALEHLTEALRLYEGLYRAEPETYRADLVDVLSSLTLGLANAGRAEESLRVAERIRELVRGLEDLPVTSATALVSVGEVLQSLGRIQEAKQVLDEGIELMDGFADLDPHLMALRATAQATRATILIAQGLITEAHISVGEAHRAVAPLVEAEPDHFAIEFAHVATIRSMLALMFQEVTAADLVDDTVARLRSLIDHGFGLLSPHFVLLLICQAGAAFEKGDLARARRLSIEAVTVTRRQTESGHHRMGQLLVHALATQAEMGARLPGFLDTLIPQARERLSGGPVPEAELIGQIALEAQRLTEEADGSLVNRVFMLQRSAKAAFAAGDRIAAISLGRQAQQMFQDAYEAGMAENMLPGPDLHYELSEFLAADEQHEAARDLAERAVRLQEDLVRADRATQHALDLVRMWRDLARKELRLGRIAETLAAATRAAEVAERRADDLPEQFGPLLARARYECADALHRLGRDEEAAGMLDSVYARHLRRPELLREHDPDLIADLLTAHARLLSGMHRTREAVRTLADRIAREPEGDRPELMILPLFRLCDALLELGEADEAAAAAARAVALARTAGRPGQVARALRTQAVCLFHQGGRHAEATALMMAALAAYRELSRSEPVHARAEVLAALGVLTVAEMSARRWPQALGYCDELVAATNGGTERGTTSWLVRRAEIHAALGAPDRARADAEAAIACYRTTLPPDDAGLQQALVTYARHLLAGERPREALDAVNESESLAHRLVRADPAGYGERLIEAMELRITVIRTLGMPAETEINTVHIMAAHLKIDISDRPFFAGPKTQSGS
ncbi:trypsin-like peptidase domain-containing protein [Nonomuraea sp. NPDC050790]|uniref:trypsin-like peptidase domain-containing protein n=1 Tax=Nonomuraea sp. NPDC050790 TaxID=3364371 RepID=UPI0037A316AD